MSLPVALNPHLKLVSYNGGQFNEKYSITNAWDPTAEEQHVSELGKNFDLVLEYTGKTEFLLSHIVFEGCGDFPIHTGLVWVSKSNPKLEEYSAKFDNFTEELFQNHKNQSEQDPVLFFKTNTRDFNCQQELSKWTSGRYIHVKFIAPHYLVDGPPRIQVNILCFLGFLDASKVVTYKHFRPWTINNLRVMPVTNAQKKGLICVNIDDDLKSKVAKLAEKYAENITLWYSTSTHCRDTLVSLGIPVDKSNIFLSYCHLDELFYQFFLLSDQPFFKNKIQALSKAKDDSGMKKENQQMSDHKTQAIDKNEKMEITIDDIEQFIMKTLNGTAVRYIGSEERPKNDMDPKFPHIVKVVGKSFDELVMESNKDVLLLLWSQKKDLPLIHLMHLFASMMTDCKTLTVAMMNSIHNDMPIVSEMMETKQSAFILFFPVETKEPICYKGKELFYDLMKFVLDNLSDKSLNKEKLLNEAKIYDDYYDVLGRIGSFRGDLEHHKNLFYLLPRQTCTQITNKLNECLAYVHHHDKKDKLKAIGDLRVKWDELLTIAKPFISILNKENSLGNMVWIHSESEFHEFIQKSPKIPIVIYFSSDRSRLCAKYVTRALADLSKKYHPGVIFGMVDIDELCDLAIAYGVKSVPSFLICKGGAVVDFLENASYEAFILKLNEYKES